MPFLSKLFDKEFKKEHLSFDYKPLKTEKIRQLNTLTNKKLKSITIQFRKNPEIPKDYKQVEDTLSRYASVKDYAITFGASVRRIPKQPQKLISFKEFFSNFFQGDLKKAIDEGVDFPSFLSNFEVEVLDTDNITRNEDILEKYERISIKINESPHSKLWGILLA